MECRKYFISTACACIALAMVDQLEAKHWDPAISQGWQMEQQREVARKSMPSRLRHERVWHGYAGAGEQIPQNTGIGPRPSQWCGWWLRTQKGGGPEYNIAWNWRNYGVPTAPQVGAIVVWKHHVGLLMGQTASGSWIVKSGNDSGAVRTRARSIEGALFRI